MKAKNTREPVSSYQGLTLDSGVPGLYWINLFGEGLAKWLGIHGFPKELAASKELAGGGISLEFCESPGECDIEVIQRQRTAIEWLGSEKFFDIRFPSRCATFRIGSAFRCRTPYRRTEPKTDPAFTARLPVIVGE